MISMSLFSVPSLSKPKVNDVVMLGPDYRTFKERRHSLFSSCLKNDGANFAGRWLSSTVVTTSKVPCPLVCVSMKRNYSVIVIGNAVAFSSTCNYSYGVVT